jgi:hypothetical protein
LYLPDRFKIFEAIKQTVQYWSVLP